ncbi:MAG TPA: hypothetical protein VHE30_24475 [Polyangiaceae bacterium]|nr:hypothetical protein [Polyangiaceae bacterium]
MRRVQKGRASLTLATALILSAPWRPAVAQSDEQRANARALATQGAEAFSGQRFAESADLFERAESLVHAPTHLLYGARAHAKLGHFVKARELYLRITREKLDASSPKPFVEAHAAAERELGAVEPHIGELTISFQGVPPKNAEVKMDDAPVPSVLLGARRPVDPGRHVIVASAPGFRTQTTEVTVADGGRASAVLTLTPDAAAGSATRTPPKAPAPATSSPPKVSSPEDRGTESGADPQRIAAYSAFGVGALGAGLGAFFLAKSASQRSKADDAFAACGGRTGCRTADPRSGDVASLDDSARSSETLGIVGLVVGGAAAATGAVLLFTADGGGKPRRSGWVAPRVRLGSVGLTGAF